MKFFLAFVMCIATVHSGFVQPTLPHYVASPLAAPLPVYVSTPLNAYAPSFRTFPAPIAYNAYAPPLTAFAPAHLPVPVTSHVGVPVPTYALSKIATPVVTSFGYRAPIAYHDLYAGHYGYGGTYAVGLKKKR